MAYWLKRWGTNEDPYRDDMLEDHLTFSEKAAPKGTPRVRERDRLIVTGVRTRGALVAVATATSEVTRSGKHLRWPWKCRADFNLKCLAREAPRLVVIPDPGKKIQGWHRTGDGLRPLTAEQFRAAERAIRRVCRTSKCT